MRRLQAKLRAGFEHHGYTLVSSFGRMARRPVTAMMTILVIAIALALPAGLYTLLKNAQRLSGSWDRLGEISVFLDTGIDAEQAAQIARTIEQQPDVRAVVRVSPEEALADFSRDSQFADALAALPDNPLPHVLIVSPLRGLGQQAVASLAATLKGIEGVDFAQFDMDWLIRFNAMLDTGKRLIQLIGGLLVLGVLLIVGNTIRLDIESRREEIEIIKMLGGTDAFIRRPFLYSGLWYGLLGGACALVLVLSAVQLLSGPMLEVADAYGSDYRLQGPGPSESMLLIAAAATIGWLGSWLAVGRHLAAIQPG